MSENELLEITRKDISETERETITTIGGFWAYMCPYCGKITLVHGTVNINIDVVNRDMDGMRGTANVVDINGMDIDDIRCYAQLMCKIKCYNCGLYFETTDELDPNIAQTISVLNMKGYETLFSCEGHDDNEFYIYFKEFFHHRILETHPLPEGLYLDENDKLSLGRFIIRSSIDHHKDKDEVDRNAMSVMYSELYKWALSLPQFDYDLPEFKDLF